MFLLDHSESEFQTMFSLPFKTLGYSRKYKGSGFKNIGALWCAKKIIPVLVRCWCAGNLNLSVLVRCWCTKILVFPVLVRCGAHRTEHRTGAHRKFGTLPVTLTLC